MSQVAALARMRFSGYARSQRVLAPVVATLFVLAVLYSSGRASPTDVYGLSAIILFGVMGWQAKLAFDTEPDAQRRLSYLAVGSARGDVIAGLISAAITAVPTIIVGVTVPWIAGAIATTGEPSAVLSAIGLGLWMHLVAAVPAVAVGALASRPITLSRGWGVTVLVTATVLVLVLGVADVPGVRWLVPQLVGALRSAQRADVLSGVLVTVHALVWSALALLGYFALRNRRR
jgi:hypothetical protein